MSVFAKNDTENAIQNLSDTWSSLTTGDLYSNWFPGSIFGMIRGIFYKTGVLNTQPFNNFADNYFKKHGGKIKRMAGVAAANIENGNFKVWNETEPNFAKAAVSSSSIPFVFPP